MREDSRVLQRIRGLLLLLVAGGTAGVMVDLFFLGHYEDSNQLIPLVLGSAGLVVFGWVALRPGMVALRVMQFVMLSFVGGGIIGITLHFKANVAQAREVEPSLSTRELFWRVVEATEPPALSPGMLVQLGLLGLVFSYRHPSLQDTDAGFGDDAST